MKVAAIDIGTNSTRILIVDYMSDSTMRVVTNRLTTTRIGENMGSTKILQEKPVLRTIDALLTYQKLCQELSVERIIVAATSAVRDARNKEVFIELVRNRLGWDVLVLGGQEEALLSYQGVTKGLAVNLTRPLVLDIGGGSTEFIWHSKELQCISVNAGAVRMTEGEYSEEEIYQILKPALGRVARDNPSTVVGVGGTVTTLAAINQKLVTYDAEKVHGYKLKSNQVSEILSAIKLLSMEQRRIVPGLQPERADIIVAGITILKLILEKLNVQEFIVSETDILYGLVYQEVSLI